MTSRRDSDQLLGVIDRLEALLHERAEHRLPPEQEEEYARLRRELLREEAVRQRLPPVILTSSTSGAVWPHLRAFAHYWQRREFVTTALEPVRAWLEGRETPEEATGLPEIPDSRTVLHTVVRLLEEEGHSATAGLLLGAVASWSVHGDDGTLRLQVPVERIQQFDAAQQRRILEAGRRVLRSLVPWYLAGIAVDPLPVSPPDEEEPLPGPTWKPERAIQHEGLWFRSKTEIRIYEALKKRPVFFFVNASGVLGGKSGLAGGSVLREPDFLVCQDGKWGILEVMGEHVHTHATAPKDHDRARLFKEYGIRMIEFYEAHRCYRRPEEVVDEFLRLLACY